MRENKKNYAIVLDTNSFGNPIKYNFEDNCICTCLDILKANSNINFFIPSIVYDELNKHIKDTINNLKAKISNSFFQKYVEINYDLIREKKTKELDNFIKKYNIEIINCNTNCNLATVNEWYFNCQKPFSAKKPKEFPDAIILSSVINYFAQNKLYNVIMISNDKDIIDGIKGNTTFEVENSIYKVLEKFVEISVDDYKNCKKYIINNKILCDNDIYRFKCYDIQDHFEINKIEDYKINDLCFMKVDKVKKYFQFYINYQLKISGEFEMIDTELSVYDREDPDFSVYWTRSGKELNLDNIEAYIEISFDDNDKLISHKVTILNEIYLNNYISQLKVNE